MLWFSKKERLIKLVNNNKEWLYDKTSLYNELIDDKNGKENLLVNEEYINTLSNNIVAEWIERINEDIDWHTH